MACASSASPGRLDVAGHGVEQCERVGVVAWPPGSPADCSRSSSHKTGSPRRPGWWANGGAEHRPSDELARPPRGAGTVGDASPGATPSSPRPPGPPSMESGAHATHMPAKAIVGRRRAPARLVGASRARSVSVAGPPRSDFLLLASTSARRPPPERRAHPAIGLVSTRAASSIRPVSNSSAPSSGAPRRAPAVSCSSTPRPSLGSAPPSAGSPHSSTPLLCLLLFVSSVSPSRRSPAPGRPRAPRVGGRPGEGCGRLLVRRAAREALCSSSRAAWARCFSRVADQRRARSGSRRRPLLRRSCLATSDTSPLVDVRAHPVSAPAWTSRPSTDACSRQLPPRRAPAARDARPHAWIVGGSVRLRRRRRRPVLEDRGLPLAGLDDPRAAFRGLHAGDQACARPRREGLT